jgi:hypothetical protein
VGTEVEKEIKERKGLRSNAVTYSDFKGARSS